MAKTFIKCTGCSHLRHYGCKCRHCDCVRGRLLKMILYPSKENTKRLNELMRKQSKMFEGFG